MPQTTLYIAASVDGYIADANGGVTWLPSGDSNGNDYGYAAFYASVDALLMGRRTYDQVLTFGEWPYPGKPAYVFTRHPPAAAPPGVEFVSADPAGFLSGLAPPPSPFRRRPLAAGRRQLGRTVPPRRAD